MFSFESSIYIRNASTRLKSRRHRSGIRQLDYLLSEYHQALSYLIKEAVDNIQILKDLIMLYISYLWTAFFGDVLERACHAQNGGVHVLKGAKRDIHVHVYT